MHPGLGAGKVDADRAGLHPPPPMQPPACAPYGTEIRYQQCPQQYCQADLVLPACSICAALQAPKEGPSLRLFARFIPTMSRLAPVSDQHESMQQILFCQAKPGGCLMVSKCKQTHLDVLTWQADNTATFTICQKVSHAEHCICRRCILQSLCKLSCARGWSRQVSIVKVTAPGESSRQHLLNIDARSLLRVLTHCKHHASIAMVHICTKWNEQGRCLAICASRTGSCRSAHLETTHREPSDVMDE